jgi:diaminopimelate decarboxylase
MSCCAYRDHILCLENASVSSLTDLTDTPFYAYSSARLVENYQEFARGLAALDATIHYAIKACANQAVVKTLAACGAGADIVSVGEMLRALQAGIPADKIVFSGVGKKDDEILAALLAGIYQINVESVSELHRISEIAKAQGLTAPISLRINPDVEAETFEKISTGHRDAKFGIDIWHLDEVMPLIQSLPGLSFKGFTMHIGSHLNEYAGLRVALSRAADVVRHWRDKGVDVERFDCGGGVPIPYDGEVEKETFADYIKVVRETVGQLGCFLSFEPGRKLVADAAVLITRVVHVKDTDYRRFVIVDAGMNDLVRPAMYGARHSVLPVTENVSGKTVKASLVGPVCESSDSFGEGFDLPADIKPGDLLAILQAGAYGSVMAGTYNARPLIAELMVKGDKKEIIRRRISVAEQIEWESCPSWL